MNLALLRGRLKRAICRVLGHVPAARVDFAGSCRRCGAFLGFLDDE